LNGCHLGIRFGFEDTPAHLPACVRTSPIMLSIRLYVSIICSIPLISSTNASLFGIVSTAKHQPLLVSSSIVLKQLRGGGDDDDVDDVPVFRPYLPYTLAIRDSIMIAHSFHNHPSFGPAGGLHGATYTVDVEFASKKLHKECNWVIDIGVASDLVAEVLKKYNYKNLDEVFGDDIMTTTEFMCQTIHKVIAEKLRERYANGDEIFQGWIKVSLWESHKAWASFEGPSL